MIRPVVVESRSAGTAWMLDSQWSFLELPAVFTGAPFGAVTEVERAAFAVVAHRAMRPRSAASVAEWATLDVVVPGVPGLTDGVVESAQRLLAAPGLRAAVEAAVLEPLRRVADGVVCLQPVPSPDGSDVLGLAVTETGVPLRLFAWPPGTDRATAAADAASVLAGAGFGRFADVRAGEPDAGPREGRRGVIDRFGEVRLWMGAVLPDGPGRRVAVEIDEPGGGGAHSLYIADADLDPLDAVRGFAAAREAVRDLTGASLTGASLTDWLALLLIRLTECDAALPWAAVRTDLDRSHEVVLRYGTRTEIQETEPSALMRRLMGEDPA